MSDRVMMDYETRPPDREYDRPADDDLATLPRVYRPTVADDGVDLRPAEGDEEPMFWSVYATRNGVEEWWIADCATEAIARILAPTPSPHWHWERPAR